MSDDRHRKGVLRRIRWLSRYLFASSVLNFLGVSASPSTSGIVIRSTRFACHTYIASTGAICSAAESPAGLYTAISSGYDSGITVQAGWLVNGRSCPVGYVSTNLPSISADLGPHMSRNNQLLLATLNQILPAVRAGIEHYGPKRIAVILGTSTSGQFEGGLAVGAFLRSGHLPDSFHYRQQELGDTAEFASRILGAQGPTYTISTACSSSGRAIIAGHRMLHSGLADLVVVGGSDSLCPMTLNGFHSLEALSMTGCRPFAADRDGITIGEASALLVLSREEQRVRLSGYGESSDAYHVSAPHPNGRGAEAAMRSALLKAKLSPRDIGYINLHGTGTELNDQVESDAVHRVFGDDVPCSSTKHLTGHTLGTCAALEAVLCIGLLTESHSSLPFQDFRFSERDPSLARIDLIETNGCPLAKPATLSNSFAFGGNNTTLIFEGE